MDLLIDIYQLTVKINCWQQKIKTFCKRSQQTLQRIHPTNES